MISDNPNCWCLFFQTDFADWTWEEFQRHRLGAAQNCSATLKGNHKLTDAVLPEAVLVVIKFFEFMNFLITNQWHNIWN